MIVDFYEAFGNDVAEKQDIPTEVLNELKKDLPHNLTYIKNEHGTYIVVPNPECVGSPLHMTAQFDYDLEKDAVLKDRLKAIPPKRWPEYLYRTQKSIAVKSIRLVDEKCSIGIENAVTTNPFSDNPPPVSDSRMYPEKFPDPIVFHFESSTGDKQDIHFQQQAYDSLTEIKFSNVDFPALKIEIYIYAPLTENADSNAKTNMEKPMSANCSVKPSNAPTVTEALAALQIFRGLFTGTVKINGQQMPTHDVDSRFDSQRVEDALSFWSIAKKLEKRLCLSFDPRADLPAEDIKFFHELDLCINQNKQIIWKHPFDHFHVSGFHPTLEDTTIDKMIGNESLRFTFLEGPIPCTLLGASFNLYSSTEMTDMVMTSIEWYDDKKQDGELYITDAPGKTWELKRRFITEKDADLLREKRKGPDSKDLK